MSDLLVKSDIKNVIKELEQESVDFEENYIASDFPIQNIKLEENKNLIFTRNKYSTRKFTQKFKLYINREFNGKCPDGIYTWALLYYNDKVVFLSTQAYNNLEIHANNSYMIFKYFNEKKIKLPSKISIIASGEIDKVKNSIIFNFSSGTYMLGRKVSEPMIYIINHIFEDIFNFDTINYSDDPTKSFIKSIDTNYAIDYVKKLPGGIKYSIVDDDTLTKLNPVYAAKIRTKIITNERKIEAMKKYNVDVSQIEEEIKDLKNELKNISKIKTKYT